MKRLFILFSFALLLSSCTNETNRSDTSSTSGENDMKLIIDNNEVDISWCKNESVEALKDISPFEIKMSFYGGFEQVGSLPQSIVSNDSRITTSPGDVVLYNSSNIVIFFGSNTWSYTELGHISLDSNELKALLDKDSVTLRIE